MPTRYSVFSHYLSMAKIIAAVVLISSLTACASTPDAEGEQEQQSVEQSSGDQSVISSSARVGDPFENINRRIFTFNYHLDQWVLKPVAKGYKKVTPDVVQLGVGNFFSNLEEVVNTANDVLQWKWDQAANDGGRFLINSTLGVGGLFDVAAKMGLIRSDGEDFGQTLAVWGVSSGPYLMLPFFGPATLRDGAGKLVDSRAGLLQYVDPNDAEYALRAVDIIDSRAQLLEAESLITGDSYTLLRDFYLQRRNYLIKDGAIQDDFGDDFGDGAYGDDYYYDE